MTLYKGTEVIASGNSSRNIGEIIQSTIPLTDAGLHLLDGSLLQGSGAYSGFVTYISGFVSSYPDLFTTEANWQNSVSTYGSCGKFVYDSTYNTVRLPKIIGFTEGTITTTSLGDLTQAGLPNIWYSNGGYTSDPTIDGALEQIARYDLMQNETSRAGRYIAQYSFDASRCSSVYGNSTTVQPQSIKVLYYICIATSVKNELSMDVAGMATKSLDNLDNFAKNIANWSSNITNCITAIPQDINLTLSSGTLTLKAGSKLYIPNGFESDGTTPKFDIYTVPSDLTRTTAGSYNDLAYLDNLSGFDSRRKDTMFFSGSSAPSGETYMVWYDTANNIVKKTDDGGSNWISGCTLPFAEITSVSGQGWVSIDQVFNGFGYIGSTMFVLPGVKGLIPNGRNADGTLKSIEFTLNRVQTVSLTTQTFTNRNFVLRNGDMGFSSVVYYDAVNNTNYNFSAYMIAATGSASSGKITSFTPKTAFHAVDYNDSPTISGWSMPSSKYKDLTLGATGSTYTAPANGWFQCTERHNGTGIGYVVVENTTTSLSLLCNDSSSKLCRAYVPVKKGDTITVWYGNINTSDASSFFRFVYAQGEI